MFPEGIIAHITSFCNIKTIVNLAATCDYYRHTIIYSDSMNEHWKLMVSEITMGQCNFDHSSTCQCSEMNNIFVNFGYKNFMNKGPKFNFCLFDKMEYASWFHLYISIYSIMPKMVTLNDKFATFKTNNAIYKNLSHIKKNLIHKIAVFNLVMEDIQWKYAYRLDYFDEVLVNLGDDTSVRLKWITVCFLIYTQTYAKTMDIISFITKNDGKLHIQQYEDYCSEDSHLHVLDLDELCEKEDRYSISKCYGNGVFQPYLSPLICHNDKYKIFNNSNIFDMKGIMTNNDRPFSCFDIRNNRFDNMKIMDMNYCYLGNMNFKTEKIFGYVQRRKLLSHPNSLSDELNPKHVDYTLLNGKIQNAETGRYYMNSTKNKSIQNWACSMADTYGFLVVADNCNTEELKVSYYHISPNAF